MEIGHRIGAERGVERATDRTKRHRGSPDVDRVAWSGPRSRGSARRDGGAYSAAARSGASGTNATGGASATARVGAPWGGRTAAAG